MHSTVLAARAVNPALARQEKLLDPKKIMSAYNEHERIGKTIAGCDKIVTPNVVKFVTDAKYGSFISYYDVSADSIGEAVEAELEYFAQRNQSFEWKTYDSDQPHNVGEVLLAHGFIEGEPESFMALDLDLNLDLSGSSPSDDSLCVQVRDVSGVRDAVAVQERVWGDDRSGQLAHLQSLMQSTPDDLAIYVIYEEGHPVSSARIDFNGDSPFAGIWGGGTLAECRGKGYYSALLHKRINDARLRGKQYLTIDASEMSRPIVEKYGFQFIGSTVPYTFPCG